MTKQWLWALWQTKHSAQHIIVWRRHTAANHPDANVTLNIVQQATTHPVCTSLTARNDHL